MDSLPVLLDRKAPAADVAALLDALDHPSRCAALQALGTAGQRALYEGAAQAEPLTLADFVPPAVPSQRPVAHVGYNTLPLPPSGRRFTKGMIRQADGGVVGWNASPWAWLIGPGYFTLRPTEGEEQRHGGVVVDYFRTPTGEVPADWPWIRPNWFGLQALVYGWCHDYMRRVGRHVTIGAAWKFHRPVGSFFVLAREDAP